jgi:DNA gyrase inhibitor GyrI
MRKRILIFSAAILAVILQCAVQADPPLAAAPAPTSISDVRVQNLKGYTYAFVSTQTSLNKLQDAIAKLIPKIDAAVDSGALRVMGPYIFTYHGATTDPNKQFTLDIGVMVKDENPKPDGIEQIKIGPLHCATVIYTGAAGQLPKAYEKLYGDIGRRGLQPTDVCREVYFYWEGPDSINNVIQVQADLSPSN